MADRGERDSEESAGFPPAPDMPPELRRTAGKNAADEAESASWQSMTGLGVEFVAAVGVFGLLGWWIDGKAGTSPWLLIVGCGLGFAVGLWQMIRVANKAMK